MSSFITSPSSNDPSDLISSHEKTQATPPSPNQLLFMTPNFLYQSVSFKPHHIRYSSQSQHHQSHMCISTDTIIIDIFFTFLHTSLHSNYHIHHLTLSSVPPHSLAKNYTKIVHTCITVLEERWSNLCTPCTRCKRTTPHVCLQLIRRFGAPKPDKPNILFLLNHKKSLPDPILTRFVLLIWLEKLGNCPSIKLS